MEEEDEKTLSSSDCDGSSDSYMDESQESEGEIANTDENPECEDLAAISPSSDADRKSQNVNDHLRLLLEFGGMDKRKGYMYTGSLLLEQLKKRFTSAKCQKKDFRKLFRMNKRIMAPDRSEIHEKMSCKRCQNETCGTENMENGNVNIVNDNIFQIDQEDIRGFAKDADCFDLLKISKRQVGTPWEEDLASWGHQYTSKSAPNAIMQASAGDEVTFVFTNQVDGKLVPIQSNISPKPQQPGSERDLNQTVNKRAFNKPQQRLREPLQSLSVNETTKRVKLTSYKRLHVTSNTDDAQMQMSLQRPNQVSVKYDGNFE